MNIKIKKVVRFGKVVNKHCHSGNAMCLHDNSNLKMCHQCYVFDGNPKKELMFES